MESYYVTESDEDSDEELRAVIRRQVQAGPPQVGCAGGGGRAPVYNYAPVTIINNNITNYNYGSTGASNPMLTIEEGNTWGSSSSVQSPQIGGQKPSFQLSSLVKGIDFGNKFAKRYYQAEKHIDKNLNLVTYTQIGSAVETISHVMALGCSSKRAKHVLILFDTGLLDQFAHEWPSPISLHDVESRLLHPLGAGFECARKKVPRKRCTLYLFGIKKRHADFSAQSFQIWKDVFYWAHHVEESEDVSSFLISPATILDFVKRAGVAVLGAAI